MRKLLPVMLSAVLTLLLCSCLPVSDNPLLQQHGLTSVTPYLGTWRVQSVRGTVLTVNCDAQVISGATEVHRITITDPTSSGDAQLRLATLNSVVYGSVKYPHSPFWTIVRPQLSGGGNTLELRGLNQDLVAADVANSVISGENYPHDGVNNVIINDDVADLRAYIIAHPNIFNTTADVILTKVP